MCRFLRFLVEQQLAGAGGELKETTVAVEVFGRKPDYDPKIDSIVRTEAARLRKRLAAYYDAEGSRDPLVIEMPKGGYQPAFRHVGNDGPERRPSFAFRKSALIAVALAVLISA